jgi:hypothetical protein
VQHNISKFLTATALLWSVAGIPPALAQSPAGQISLADIAAVCSGMETTIASGGRGVVGSTDFQFEVTPDKELRVTRTGGQLIGKIEKFTYQDYTKCIADLVAAIAQAPQPQPQGATPSEVVFEPATNRWSKESEVNIFVNNNGGEKELRNLRIGLYDAADTPVPFAKAPDNMDEVRLSAHGMAQLTLHMSASPMTIQVCTDIVDIASGKTIAQNHRLFFVVRGQPSSVDRFATATTGMAQRLEGRLSCPPDMREAVVQQRSNPSSSTGRRNSR